MHRFRTSIRQLAGLSATSLFALVAGSAPTPVAAQPALALHVEAGGAVMVSPHQRHVMGYRHGLSMMVRPEVRITDTIGIELNVGGLWFPSDDGVGQVILAGGGMRFQPAVGDWGRLVLDAHANYANSDGRSRFAFDTGLSYEMQATDHIGIGPYIRYTHVMAARASDGGDATMLSYGLTLAVGPTPEGATADSDEDGVLDYDDVCEDEAIGEVPDPDRLGCPLRDEDQDGVFDQDDLCVNENASETPDPARRGCPLRDADHDGVLDDDDVCPAEAVGAVADPMRVGCPRVDADGDGVFDSDDRCPETAAGAQPDPNLVGCPDGDDDGDAVLNSVDQCRTEHANMGFHPDAARLGCPMADRDHDMVPDATDACPDRAGAPSTNARRNGCPGLVAIQLGRIVIERPVFFATGQDHILGRSSAVLAAIVDVMNSTPAIRRISIEGHTDDVGTSESNRDLSVRRAESVKQWLIAHGVEASRLEAHGVGESQPDAAGQTAEAREQNRQVDFLVTDPAPTRSEGGSR